MTVGSLSRPTTGRVEPSAETAPSPPPAQRLMAALSGRPGFVLALVAGATLRCWQLGSVGFNSDEAVYAGQAASIAAQTAYLPYFPIFRAHPLLFQSLLSLFYHVSVSDLVGRLLSVLFGVATLVVVYALGKLLYGRRAGLVAMLLLAVMPYHVTVTRQVLLDGPMVFFATSALYLLARYCRGLGERWLLASAGSHGIGRLDQGDGHRPHGRDLLLLHAGAQHQGALPHGGSRRQTGAGRFDLSVGLRFAGASRQRWQLSGLAAVPSDRTIPSRSTSRRSLLDRPRGDRRRPARPGARSTAAGLAGGTPGGLGRRAG